VTPHHKRLPRGLRPLAPDWPCRTNQPVTTTVHEPVVCRDLVSRAGSSLVK